MIAFQIQLNKEDVCIAGIEIEGVVSAIATFARRTTGLTHR
ncbi:hypothetical protein [aff. Roholtiella sp. LEGE 12411]|nr:hypothetical protein [aff. Roholtiella sp. LEGE 12411]